MLIIKLWLLINTTPSDKIIIGSFQGILRIYKPRGGGGGGGVEDVVVEQAFKAPILQVEVGRFSSWVY